MVKDRTDSLEWYSDAFVDSKETIKNDSIWRFVLKSVRRRFQEKLVFWWGTTMTYSKAGKGNPHYLSVVLKKQNETTAKNLMIFCRKTISKIMWKNIWKNEE